MHLQDSGEREQYVDGSAIREPETGKGRYDLISPIALHRLAVHYERGTKKYADRNWEKGIPLSRLLSSAARHLNKLIAGMEDEDHAAAVAWNIFAFIHIKEMINRDKLSEGYNDLPEPMEL
ncbi:MAG: dATP/dGTP diphosphohydrolase domain-containing protein [Methanogenium sp.]|jgi:hypothetical protein